MGRRKKSQTLQGESVSDNPAKLTRANPAEVEQKEQEIQQLDIEIEQVRQQLSDLVAKRDRLMKELLNSKQKKHSLIAEQTMRQLDEAGINYVMQDLSQLRVFYEDKELYLDLRTGERRWYIVKEGSIASSGYYFSGWQKLRQSIEQYRTKYGAKDLESNKEE